MVVETAEKVMGTLGAADIEDQLEEQLIDGILYAFQEQTTESLAALKAIVNVMDILCRLRFNFGCRL